MGKVFKKAGKNKARAIVEYEHAVLEDPLDLAGALDGIEAGMDPEALRGNLVAQALADARSEAEAKVREAYNEGLRRGFEAGREEFQRAVGSAAEALAAATDQIAQSYEQFLESLEPQVMRLVQGIVERVIGREVRMDPELVVSAVRRALACLTDRARLTVRVNPADLEALRNQKAALLERIEGVVQFSMEGDESVSPGGCTVDTDTCHVDARIEEILNRVLDDLAD